jgi:hypothetical protein
MSLPEPLHTEIITWPEVDRLVDILTPQVRALGSLDGIIMITRGGIIPGGLLAEALGIRYILTAAVSFAESYSSQFPLSNLSSLPNEMLALPSFLQFPEARLVKNRRLLLVDDVWGSGRTSLSIKGRLVAEGAGVFTCVFHYNPYRSLFPDQKPDIYGAVTDAFVVYPWEIDRGTDSEGELEGQF